MPKKSSRRNSELSANSDEEDAVGDLTYDADTYREVSQVEHVKMRPEMYGGSSRVLTKKKYLLVQEEKGDVKIESGKIRISDLLERTWLEILTNSGDNVIKSRAAGVNPGEIRITRDGPILTFWNSGKVIPVVQKTEGVWLPSLIFGKLLTGSNLNEGQDNIGAGLNGIGGKLTNIFSDTFQLRVGDPSNGLLFEQTWTNGMLDAGEPVVEEYEEKTGFVEVSFILDFKALKFKDMENYSLDMFRLLQFHAINASYLYQVPVRFWSRETEAEEFFEQIFNLQTDEDFIHLHFPGVENFYVHREYPKGVDPKEPGATPCKLVAYIDTMPGQKARHISWVNGMITMEGGVHIDVSYKSFSDLVCPVLNAKAQGRKVVKNAKGELVDEAKTKEGKAKAKKMDPKKAAMTEKLKTIKVTLTQVKENVSILSIIFLPNPKFIGQTKEKVGSFVDHHEQEVKFTLGLPKDLPKKVEKWNLVKALEDHLNSKIKGLLKATDGSKARFVYTGRGTQANKAGTNQSDQCTLWVPEGVSGMGYAERQIGYFPGDFDYHGVMPLRGKLLNVMKAKPEQIAENKEIISLKKWLGLQEGVDYSIPENYLRLRYGSLCIAADADPDGYHILLLVVVYFHRFFPELLEIGFVQYIRTPLYVVRHKGKVFRLFTEQEMQEWKTEHPDAKLNDNNCKYYKGLGGFDDDDGLQEFEGRWIVSCGYDDEASDKLDMIFTRKEEDTRKEWILRLWDNEEPEIITEEGQEITDLIHKSYLSVFAKEALERAVPDLGSGLKKSQKQALWGMMDHYNLHKVKSMKAGREKIKKCGQWKVAQAASHAAEVTHYAHGEGSLGETYIKMGQKFTGARLMPLVHGFGDWGSRKDNGENHAATRYIYLKPAAWLMHIFRPEDFPLLEFAEVDDFSGKVKTEPKFFLPVIPVGLINGANGMAVGWSTTIPSFHPSDIVRYILSALQGQKGKEPMVYFKDFNGEITLQEKKIKPKAMSLNQRLKETRKKRKERKKQAEEDRKAEETEEEEEAEEEEPEDPQEPEEESEEEDPELNDLEPREVDMDQAEIGDVKTSRHWEVHGVFEEIGRDRYRITEIPPGRRIDKYQIWLEKEVQRYIETKGKEGIAKVIWHCVPPKKNKPTDSSCKPYKVDIVIERPQFEVNLPSLRLVQKITSSNMVFLDPLNSMPIRYRRVDDYLEDFISFRLEWYEKRRLNIIAEMKERVVYLTYKRRFIQAILEDEVVYKRITKANLRKQMVEILEIPEEYCNKLIEGVAINNLTEESLVNADKKMDEARMKEKEMEETTAADIWFDDLKDLVEAFPKEFPGLEGAFDI